MKDKQEPTIENYQGNDYTKVTYRPDFPRFEINRFSPDMINLMKRRVYDMSGILKVKVYLNGKLVPVHTFKDYAKRHLEDENSIMA